MDSSLNLPQATTEPAFSPPASRWRWRWVVNAWLVLHVSAVIIAPASVTPSSDLVRSVWTLFQPYLQVLYLNHGYHFFAPEPSQSTLLAYEAQRPDGTVIRGQFPNRDIKPRLLYHRHFMLTEQMPSPPEAPGPGEVAPAPGELPELPKMWFGSYARHIGRQHGASKVRLIRVTHYLPTMEMVRNGVKLDDERSFSKQFLGEFPCDPL